MPQPTQAAKDNYRDHLYILSFLDLADKLDILLLEIRHLQQSIIYLLHIPTLYLPLRYEEQYIFGEWDQLLHTWENDPQENFLYDLKYTNRAIIRYPSPRKVIKDHVVPRPPNQPGESEAEWAKDWAQIAARLEQRVYEIWSGDNWARGQRRHYFALSALQILKQRIFRDKLTLFRRAKHFKLTQTDHSQSAPPKPAFLILRQGIIHRVERYIAILRTHKQQLEKSLSFGLQDFPKPDVDRRREIGIFQDFLSTRSVDIQQDMMHLVGTLTGTDAHGKNKKTTTNPLLLHGWSQSNSMSNSQLYDTTNRDSFHLRRGEDRERSTESRNRGFPVQHVMYMDTSFWSPDRPDLQPLIAKELAFSIVRDQLRNFDPVYISNTNSNDLLADLFICLHKEINEYTYERGTPFRRIRKNIHLFLCILFDDIIAASTKGIAYLYALYLSIVGEGLHDLLSIGPELRLEIIDELPTGGSPQGLDAYAKNYLWYFRLRITAYWLEKVMHVPTTLPDQIILRGVREVSDELIDFLDQGIPPNRDKTGHYWKLLAERMEKHIENSPAMLKTHQWRHKRSIDTWDEDHTKSGKKVYRHSTMRLDIRLQNYLFRRMLEEKKSEKNKIASLNAKTTFTELLEPFRHNFLCQTTTRSDHTEIREENIPNQSGNTLRHSRWLFRHLYDIPFQSAMLRAIEIIQHAENAPISWKEFTTIMHRNMTLGREVFATALEFYTWSRESTKSRLLLCMNLLKFAYPEIEVQDFTLAQRLKHWINGSDQFRQIQLEQSFFKSVCNLTLPNNPSEQDYMEIISRLTQHPREKLRSKLLHGKLLEYIGAEKLHSLFYYVSEIKTHNERRLEQIAGYKLRQLCVILDEAKQQHKLPQKLQPLREFLFIHHSDKEHGDIAEARFYDQLLPAFGDTRISPETIDSLPQRIPRILINRMSFSNYYPPAPGENTPANAMSLQEGMKTIAGDGIPNITPTLGQYGSIQLRPVRLPCKCELMHFIRSKPQIDDRYITHFSRREIAIPVNIWGINHPDQLQPKAPLDPDILKGVLEQEFFILISISLQRREMRLNLIYRLLQAVAQVDISKVVELPLAEDASLDETFHWFAQKHHQHFRILGLLTDGWGDFLLVFYTDGTQEYAEYMTDLLKLQVACYEDFMTDRAEITLTPEALWAMRKAKQQGNGIQELNIRLHTRLMEDRRLETVYRDLQKKFRNHPYFRLLSASGRLDFMFTPTKTLEDMPLENYSDWLAKLDEGVSWPNGLKTLDLFDKIETTVFYQTTPSPSK